MSDHLTFSERWIHQQRNDLMLIQHHEQELARLRRRVYQRERDLTRNDKETEKCADS